MGLTLNAAPEIGDPPERWGALGSGQLNVVSDERIFARVLADMRQRLGIPHIEVAPPVGLRSTEAFWAALASGFALGDHASDVVGRHSADALEARDRARKALGGSRLGYHVAGRKDFSLPVVVREGLMYVDLFSDLGFEVVLLFQGSPEDDARQRVSGMLESRGIDVPFHFLRDRGAVTRAISEHRLDVIHCSDSLREEVARAGVPLIPIGSMRPGFEGLVHNVDTLLSLAGLGGGES
jgi:nitrogenase molybdenum-iron protein alpha/beta subunit